MEILLIAVITLSLLNLIAILILFFRMGAKQEELAGIEKNQERLERVIREEIAGNRLEIMGILRSFEDAILKELTSLTQVNEQKLENMRGTIEQRLRNIQEDNSRELDRMRHVVEQQLQSTLEKRLTESFKLVNSNLESVQKGLGEMQSLAAGVGDLKKVLTNVKTRGIWGEIQLAVLLEQILTPDQYEKNIVTKKGSNERVEFAVKLPGREDKDEPVLLPIDAKFPQEDYQRLVEAQESANVELAEKYARQLEIRIKAEAKEIKEKYIDPPYTPDFAIMFLPIEGLYAEVLRRPGLCEVLQREYRVVVTGPTTLAALLNSLQMGFRTLAIEKRSSEVWRLLGVVKTEFAKFGDILERTRKKLQEATDTIDKASSKTRNIRNKLDKVQNLPSSDIETLVSEDSSVDKE
jgi:DNA recombination protein RmuC